MSIDIMSAVWKYGPANSTERFVLLSIADRADDVGYCYPSYNDIAKRCAISRPTVIKAINRMRSDGWIRTEAAFKKDGSRSSNGIYINLEKLAMLEIGSKESLPGVVKKRDGGSKESLPGVVKKRDGGSKESLPKSSINHQLEPSMKQGEGDPPPVAVRYGQFDRTPGPNGKGYSLPDEPIHEHPAAQLMQRLTKCYAGDGDTGLISEKLGDAPDEGLLARAVEFWKLSGYSLRNWIGIADWYGELKRDPTWEPSKRFKNGHNNGRAGQPAAPVSVSTPAPGSQPVMW